MDSPEEHDEIFPLTQSNFLLNTSIDSHVAERYANNLLEISLDDPSASEPRQEYRPQTSDISTN
jgi:hypothetical protein